MTHTVYTQTDLESMPVSELKTIAGQLGAIPNGDKRVKQTWVSAVLDHQILEKSGRSGRKSTETQSQQQVQERPSMVEKVVEVVGKSETGNTESSLSNGLNTSTTHGSQSGRSSQPSATVTIDNIEPIEPAGTSVGTSIVLIVLAAILYAVCLVPIGLGIIVYRLVGWCRQRFGNQARSSRSSRIDYFPFPA
jgi:cobalamin biosynthesis Mg chelatase CobN